MIAKMTDFFLLQANMTHIDFLHSLQEKAFKANFEKLQNPETNPYCDPIEKLEERVADVDNYQYFRIYYQHYGCVGMVAVKYNKNVGDKKYLSIFAIIPEFQNKGLGAGVMKALEDLYGKDNWTVKTPLKEERNVHFYEKIGFKQVEMITLSDGIEIVVFKK